MKKIAHIQLLPILTGVQRVSLDELTRLSNVYFDKYLICQSEGLMTKQALNHGIKCHYVPHLVREISPLNDIKAFISIYNLCRKHKFDIVHTHSSKTGVLGRLAAKLAGVPMIVHTVHGFAFPAAKNNRNKLLYWLLEWLGAKCSDKIICLHNDDKIILNNKLGVKNDKIAVLPNGVDLNKYTPPTDEMKLKLREKNQFKKDHIIIGMNGRLWEQKNPQMLLHSAIEIIRNRDDVQFIFSGDGDLRAELESIIANSNVQDKISILGWRNDIHDVLKTLDIFVLPSRWEGMPLAIIEAQATGLPCIASNIPGNNHLITHEVDGLLFDLNSKEQLTESIITLINNTQKRKQLGDNAHIKSCNCHNVNHRINKIALIYTSFFKKPRHLEMSTHSN